MKYLLPSFCLFLSFFLFSCNSTKKETVEDDPSVNSVKETKTVEPVNFQYIETLIEESENVQVINFWATWCGPCVKELPSFEKANQKFSSQNVGFTLVSIDFVEDLDTKVIPFSKKRDLKSSVVLLDDTNYDSWIHKVSEDWDGAIPATLIVNKSKNIKNLLVGELTYEELEQAISESL